MDSPPLWSLGWLGIIHLQTLLKGGKSVGRSTWIFDYPSFHLVDDRRLCVESTTVNRLVHILCHALPHDGVCMIFLLISVFFKLEMLQNEKPTALILSFAGGIPRGRTGKCKLILAQFEPKRKNWLPDIWEDVVNTQKLFKEFFRDVYSRPGVLLSDDKQLRCSL